MKIGVALSGGTLRGAAHIGVLEVLQEAGIRPDLVAGTSAGSVVAALYAHGLHPKMLGRIANSLQGRQLIDWTASTWDAMRFVSLLPMYWAGLMRNFSRLLPVGFIRGQKFELFLSQLFQLPPTQPKVPLFVTSVDIHSTEAVIFTDSIHPRTSLQGFVYLPMEDKAACVRASCSMPGVFTPRVLYDRTLVDGAVRVNIPAIILQEAGCDKIIVVDLMKSEIRRQALDTFFDIFLRSWDIMVEEIAKLQMRHDPVFTIEPITEDVGWTSFDKIEYCIEQGRMAARNALPELLEYIKKPTV